MCCPDHVLREWSRLHNRKTGHHGPAIVEHLFRIISLGLCNRIGLSACLNFKNLSDGHVRAFDLGRKHRFLRGQGPKAECERSE